MFAVANVQEFLKDHADIAGKKTKSILKRAVQLSSKGLLADDSITKVFGDESLASQFFKVAVNSTPHIVLRITAMHKAVYAIHG